MPAARLLNFWGHPEVESPLIFWGVYFCPVQNSFNTEYCWKGDSTHESIQLKCIRDIFYQAIKNLALICLSMLQARLCHQGSSVYALPSQPLPPAQLREHCLGARWERAFLQHVLSLPKGLLHIQHAHNKCTIGKVGDICNLCSNRLWWLIKSSDVSILHVWAHHTISEQIQKV